MTKRIQISCTKKYTAMTKRYRSAVQRDTEKVDKKNTDQLYKEVHGNDKKVQVSCTKGHRES